MGALWSDNAHLVMKHNPEQCSICKASQRQPKPPEIPEFLKDTFQSFKKESNAQTPVVPDNEASRC